MRCQEFEAHVTDLTRNAVMDAATRAESLRHAEECLRCRAALVDHQRLVEGLRALAETGRAIEPPASVEASLLQAFRENRAAASAGTTPGRRWTPWLAVAAAAMLIAMIGAITLISRDTGDQTPRLAGPDLARATPPAPPEDPAGERTAGPESAANHDQRAVAIPAALLKANHRPRPRPPVAERLSGREITTDFIPLAYGAEYIPIESGQIIRVKMPRSALISFGLPMSQDRIDEQVKADILFSNDGLAHAIRFVQ